MDGDSQRETQISTKSEKCLSIHHWQKRYALKHRTKLGQLSGHPLSPVTRCGSGSLQESREPGAQSFPKLPQMCITAESCYSPSLKICSPKRHPKLPECCVYILALASGRLSIAYNTKKRQENWGKIDSTKGYSDSATPTVYHLISALLYSRKFQQNQWS